MVEYMYLYYGADVLDGDHDEDGEQQDEEGGHDQLHVYKRLLNVLTAGLRQIALGPCNVMLLSWFCMLFLLLADAIDLLSMGA